MTQRAGPNSLEAHSGHQRPLKIVYCHNYYRLRGGEDLSFENDVAMLREQGHTVIPFVRDNRELPSSAVRVAAGMFWNPRTAAEMARLLRLEKPDLLHCNNLFPQISVSVYRAAKRAGVPVVQALRNYRAFCANALLYRDSAPCTKCLGAAASWHGLRHRCYRNSGTATAMVASMQLLHRLLRIQRRYVAAFFTPTEFARAVHIKGGFDPNSVFVRSNFVSPDLGIAHTRSDHALFVGRLSSEKGVDVLLDTWMQKQIPIPLKIIGEGPEAARLRSKAAGCRHVTFAGRLEPIEVLQELGHARFLVMPSRWYETFGRTIAEAFSRGTPVLASRFGAMAELVQDGENGFLFDPADPSGLADAVQRFEQRDAVELRVMQSAARLSYERYFSARASYQQLLRVHRHALTKATQHGMCDSDAWPSLSYEASL